MQETWVQSLSQEDTLEKEMATHSSILSWETPWIEKPGELQGVTRVGHDLATELPPPYIVCVCVCIFIYTHIYTYIYKFLYI